MHLQRAAQGWVVGSVFARCIYFSFKAIKFKDVKFERPPGISERTVFDSLPNFIKIKFGSGRRHDPSIYRPSTWKSIGLAAL